MAAPETASHMVYATPSYNHRSTRVTAPRFDPILINDSSNSIERNYKGYKVARARLFFSIELQGRKIDLALIDMYETVSG